MVARLPVPSTRLPHGNLLSRPQLLTPWQQSRILRASAQEDHLHVGRGEWPVAVLMGLQARPEPQHRMADKRAWGHRPHGSRFAKQI